MLKYFDLKRPSLPRVNMPQNSRMSVFSAFFCSMVTLWLHANQAVTGRAEAKLWGIIHPRTFQIEILEIFHFGTLQIINSNGLLTLFIKLCHSLCDLFETEYCDNSAKHLSFQQDQVFFFLHSHQFEAEFPLVYQ